MQFQTHLRLILILSVWYSSYAHAKVVRYELTATQATANISGKKPVDFVLLVNGQLPAPTLEFEEGDLAEITLLNKLPSEEVSIHWHGLLLPPEMDGVPYVNTPPIRSGEKFVYRFPIRQSGTYWYHTHTSVQEQKGIYGAIIIHPKEKPKLATRDVVLVVSDWSDEDANQILAHLRKDGDYYLFKKGTIRSLWGAYQAGAMGVYWSHEWSRMGGMDLSDVGYDAFLLNGKAEGIDIPAKAGERLRLRIVNAAASSYFQIALADQSLQVVAADGQEVVPRRAKELLIGMAETYDLIFEVPDDKMYELKVRAQDGTGSVSAWIGNGPKIPAPVGVMPDLYAPMDHNAHTSHSSADVQSHTKPSVQEHGHQHNMKTETDSSQSHQGVQQNHSGDHHHHHHHPSASNNQNDEAPIVNLLTVDDLKAPQTTAFPDHLPTHDIKLVLGGDMERYVWHINGKAIFEERTIEIREGERIRFTFENQTMMHHPMHLHGHFFRVLSDKMGDFAPLKHTVDVPPHQSRTIEFFANEPGRWMLHCHNLYHMKTGMSRVIQYSSYEPSAELKRYEMDDPHRHDHIYSKGEFEISSFKADFSGKLMQTWNEIDFRVASGEEFKSKTAEAELLYRRWYGNYLSFLVGVSQESEESYGVLGLSYLLPLLIESELVLNHQGDLRLELAKHLQWTSTLFSELELQLQPGEKAEWEASLMYASNWHWAVGFKAENEHRGLGVRYRF